MRIVIVGAGEIGTELAMDLFKSKKNEIALIDIDEKRCEMLAADTDAFVITGDGTNPEILKKAQISDADVLIAATGSDPLNTVIAMLAKSFQVEKIIVKLDKIGLRSANRAIGVEKIVAPKISAVAEILSAVYGFDRVDFSMAARGGLKLLELEAGNGAGRHISELGLPDGSHLVAVIRDEEVILPRDKIKLQNDDKLLVLVENEGVRNKIRNVFERKEQS